MIPEFVTIKLNSRNVQRLQSLGYTIPQTTGLSGCKYGFGRGAEITIKTSDLSAGSKVPIKRICDKCGKEDLVNYRDLGSREFCKKCSSSNSVGPKNPFYGKKHSKDTLNKIKSAKQGKDYSVSYKNMGARKTENYARERGYPNYKAMELTLVSHLEKTGCGARNKAFLKAFNIGSQAVVNCLHRAGRLDLLMETEEFRTRRLQQTGEVKKESFAKKCGFESREDLEQSILKFFEENKVPPYSDLVRVRFPFISLTKIVQILISHGKSELFNTTQSSFEVELLQFLQSVIPNTEIVKNSRIIIKPYELDLFIPEHNLAIEFNGLYWHCELHKPKTYHLDKRKLCESKGINLIQINADEWALHKPIVRSIIKAKLKIFDAQIHARKCEIRAVPQAEAVAFLEANHLMQSSRGFKSVGLYFGGALVSLLTYKKHKTGLDVARFCNKLNTLVFGGLSRLLAYVRRENPTAEYVQSFVDLRYGTGFSLEALGFKNEGESLGWAWTDFKFTYNRLRCVANMDSRGLTESEHAEELGWARIYDAGQRKWVFRYSET